VYYTLAELEEEEDDDDVYYTLAETGVKMLI
jgi:hypothetical protein